MAKQSRGDIRVGGFVAALGLLLLGAAWWTGNRLRSWPAVEAEVIQSEVSGPSHLGSGKTFYYTKVEFRFAADGKQFTASSSDKSDSLWLAHQTATAFALGTRHTIRYNPASPNKISFNAGYFKPVYMVRFFLQPILLGMSGLALTGCSLQLVRKSRPRP
jgi:hypothetical protein